MDDGSDLSTGDNEHSVFQQELFGYEKLEFWYRPVQNLNHSLA
jgi:hypothetical protein